MWTNEGEAQFEGGNFPFRGNQTTRNYPLLNLPKNLDYKRGEVSLVADFSSQENNRVPVFLINASNENFRMETIALELPIVLEAHLGNGHWERAEPHNAYGFRKTKKVEHISSSNFRVKKARNWSTGMEAELRYAFYQDGKAVIISETFQGFLPVGEIDKARHDLMAASLVPEPLRIRYYPDRTTTGEIEKEWFNKLRLLKAFGPCHVDLSEAQRWAAFVHENAVATREERDLAIRLQLEMLQPWPSQYDIDSLHQFCEQTLLKFDTETQALRPLCWEVVTGFANGNNHQLELGKLAEVAWQKISNARTTDREKRAAADFLCENTVTVNYNPLNDKDENFALLASDNPYVRITAANTIMAMGKKHKLDRSPDRPVLTYYLENEGIADVYELVRILHFDRLYNPYASPNWVLWERALDKNLEYTIPRLSLMFEADDRPTSLRKFSQTSALSKTIRAKLSAYASESPDSDGGKMAKRLIENTKSRRNRLFQQTIRDPFFQPINPIRW